jgi:hypothetical protein
VASGVKTVKHGNETVDLSEINCSRTYTLLNGRDASGSNGAGYVSGSIAESAGVRRRHGRCRVL